MDIHPPGTVVLAQYCTQVRTYLRATGAGEGLIVFVTSGRVEQVAGGVCL